MVALIMGANVRFFTRKDVPGQGFFHSSATFPNPSKITARRQSEAEEAEGQNRSAQEAER